MAQYGSYEMGYSKKNMVKEDGSPVTIPFGKNLKEGLSDFFGDCWCGIRVEEGMIFHLIGDNTIRVNVMDIQEVYPLEEYIGFCLEIEKPIRDQYGNNIDVEYIIKNIIIPYDKIIYIDVLPYNPKTYRMG